MNIEHRIYGGKFFRPEPVIEKSADGSTLFIATPWGPPEVATEFVESCINHLQSTQEDPDKTLIFTKKKQVTSGFSQVRESILRGHADILKKYNEEELTAGVELLCLYKSNNSIAWLQVGAPFFAILNEASLLPINHPIDLSYDYTKDATLPPLPKALIGIDNAPQIMHGQFLLKEHDRLLLVARSYLPHAVFSTDPQSIDLESLSLTLAQDNEDLPFWAGVVGF